MSSKDRRIEDLEGEVRELRGFAARGREERERRDEIFKAIYAEHQPMLIPARDSVVYELRCRRCRTDEHHTWGTDYYLPWPCPTLAPFVAYAVYKPAEAISEVTE
ncbi:hypothetical protein ACWCW7_34400 [Nocardia tengchongensis]